MPLPLPLFSLVYFTVSELLEVHRKLAISDMLKKKEKEEAAKAKKAERERLKKEKKEKEEQKKKAEAGEEDVVELGSDGFDVDAALAAKPAAGASPDPSPSAAAPTTEEKKEKDGEKEGEEEEEDDTPPPPGNGGTVEGKYVWTQTLQEVALQIDVPKGTRGRDVTVSLKKNSFKVQLKGQEPICDGKWHAAIIVDDSFWTIEDGERIVVNIQKFNQMEWWKCPMVGDPEINTQKVQPENSKLADLDGDTRQTVEKMMFDQRAKAMGTPTSDEQKKAEILERFKMQHPEMDFSNAKMS